MKAIILAGKDQDDIQDFNQGKALINIKGKPLINYTIDALKQCESIESIIVVGNKELLDPLIGGEVGKIIEQKGDLLDNLINSFPYVKGEDRVLVTTCDIPLITTEAIDDLILRDIDIDYDILYPVIERSVYESKFPDLKRTYTHLQEGSFTGGNIVIIKPDRIQSVEKEIRVLIENRKNPLKMVKILGPSIVLQMLGKRLTIEMIEEYIKDQFNIEAKAVLSPYPEIASDIDNIEDIELLRKYI